MHHLRRQEGRTVRQSSIGVKSPTLFEQSVYDALLTIPAGEVRTYAQMAQAIGRPAAVRAVGQALARNPHPITVPCHRVVRADGSLGGYSGDGGPAGKRALLEAEGVSFDAGGRVRL